MPQPFLDLNGDIKPWLGIEITETKHDATLIVMRDSVEQSMLNYTEAKFDLTAIEEVLDGSRSDQIVPAEFPIASVQALYFHVKPDGTEGDLIESDDYQVKEGAIILQHLYTPKGRSLLRIDYTYGYDGIPPDVHEAMLLAIEAKFRRKGRKSMGLSGRSKKDEREGYSDSAGAWDSKTGLPTEVVYMLQPYKRYEMPTQPIAQRNR